MARTKAQILTNIEANAPSFLADSKIGAALLGALASILAMAETSIDALVALVFTQTATGSWLDELGAELSSPRESGESDATYRARLFLEPIGVTLPALQALIDARIERYYGFGWSARLVEPYHYGAGSIAVGDSDAIAPPLDWPNRPADFIWLNWPDLPVERPADDLEAVFVGDGAVGIGAVSDAGEAWERRFVFELVRVILDERRAAGVAWGAGLNTTDLSPILLDLLFILTPGEGSILLRS